MNSSGHSWYLPSTYTHRDPSQEHVPTGAFPNMPARPSQPKPPTTCHPVSVTTLMARTHLGPVAHLPHCLTVPFQALQPSLPLAHPPHCIIAILSLPGPSMTTAAS